MPESRPNVQRKDTADQIAAQLTSEGHSVASLHAGKDTGDRDGVLDTFRNGQTKVLITTNVVARGIDISQVNMVVNYDVPVDRDEYGKTKIDLESYIHRIGMFPPLLYCPKSRLLFSSQRPCKETVQSS
jgi:ATP-dependent RNA helicase DDX19/DBP5